MKVLCPWLALLLSSQFYKWGNWGMGHLGKFSKGRQLQWSQNLNSVGLAPDPIVHYIFRSSWRDPRMWEADSRVCGVMIHRRWLIRYGGYFLCPKDWIKYGKVYQNPRLGFLSLKTGPEVETMWGLFKTLPSRQAPGLGCFSMQARPLQPALFSLDTNVSEPSFLSLFLLIPITWLFMTNTWIVFT